MGKYSDAFDEQARIASERKSAERKEAEQKREAASAERRRIMRPLHNIVEPTLLDAKKDLVNKGVDLNIDQHRSLLRDAPEHSMHFVLSQKHGSFNAYYIFSVLSAGFIVCTRRSIRDDVHTQQQLLRCPTAEFGPDNVENIVMLALADLMGNKQ